MKTAAAGRGSENLSSEAASPPGNEPTQALHQCVRDALHFYLRHLGGHPPRNLRALVIGEVERPLIETVLEHTQGNQTRAAMLLGVSRPTLRTKMAIYGIRRRT